MTDNPAHVASDAVAPAELDALRALGASRPVAIVTGATKRVGLASACALAARGCDLVITYRTDPRAAALAVKSIERAGSAPATRAAALRLDLDDLASVERLGVSLSTTLARVDVLVHNASLYEPTAPAVAGSTSTPGSALDLEQTQRFMRVNAWAPLVLSRVLAARLGASTLPGRGAIVAMGDIHAMGEGGQPRRGFVGYAMSKAALLEAMLVLARELSPRVRVNVVAPGVVAFPERGHESDLAAQELYLRRVPLGRAGTSEDAAAAVAFLALDAHYTTGQVLRVDGGRAIT